MFVFLYTLAPWLCDHINREMLLFKAQRIDCRGGNRHWENGGVWVCVCVGGGGGRRGGGGGGGGGTKSIHTRKKINDMKYVFS